MAGRQIRESLASAGQPASGVIAISVGRILNPGTHYFAAHLEVLGDRVLHLLEANMRDCQRAARATPNICAVLFHVGTPGHQADLITRMTYSVLYDAGAPSEAFERLARNIEPLYVDEQE